LNMAESMNCLMRETSRELTKLSGRINQTYGGPYAPTEIKTYGHLMNAYKYIYRNPQEARLSKIAESHNVLAKLGAWRM
jgi:putative transposase